MVKQVLHYSIVALFDARHRDGPHEWEARQPGFHSETLRFLGCAAQAYQRTPNDTRSAKSAIPAHHLDANRRPCA